MRLEFIKTLSPSLDLQLNDIIFMKYFLILLKYIFKNKYKYILIINFGVNLAFVLKI